MNTVLKKSSEIALAMFPAEKKWSSRTRHITCIWDKTRLVSVGENSEKTHTINRRNNKNNFDLGQKRCCSEWSAINRAKNTRSNLNWKKLTIVNIRVGRKKEFLMSRPCIFCQSLLQYFSCSKVFYTDNNGEFQRYE